MYVYGGTNTRNPLRLLLLYHLASLLLLYTTLRQLQLDLSLSLSLSLSFSLRYSLTHSKCSRNNNNLIETTNAGLQVQMMQMIIVKTMKYPRR